MLNELVHLQCKAWHPLHAVSASQRSHCNFSLHTCKCHLPIAFRCGNNLNAFYNVNCCISIACVLLQGVRVIQYRLPVSLFKHLSVNQVCHPPQKCFRARVNLFTIIHASQLQELGFPSASTNNRTGHLFSATISWRFVLSQKTMSNLN